MPNASVTSLDKISDLVLQLRTQRVNAVVIEDTVAKGYTLDGTVTLAKAVPEDAGAETAVGIRKGNAELLASVNKTLARLKADGSIEKFSTEASALSADRQVSSNNIVDIFGNTAVYTLRVSATPCCCLRSEYCSDSSLV